MLTQTQINQIREHLESAQNPLFFFDNDLDGLCSFLILQRYLNKGRGVPIKTFPALDESYFRKVEEFNADYIFILDKPIVSKEFFDRIRERNIPIVWIDHHAVENVSPDFVSYYNPFFNDDKQNEPVTFLCYQITKRREDLWLAVLGCIADGFLPPFYEEFRKMYGDLSINSKDSFEVLYKSRLGKLAVLVSNGLKDKTTNVILMIKFLIGAKSPYEVMEDNSKTFSFHRRSEQIYSKYLKILNVAKGVARVSGSFLFFKYSGDLSISGELSNELKFNYPSKNIVVAYVNGSKVNLSLRGKNIREKFLKVIDGIVGATGGGHNDAVGGMINLNDLDIFRERLEEELKNSKI